MAKNFSELKLECTGIGSLPQTNLEEAMDIIKKYFKNIPYWPQLTNLKEDIITLFSGDMSSFNSIGFDIFIDYIAQNKPPFAKGQITGPCTMSKELGINFSFEKLLNKAMLQINKIKSASPDTTPIIFIDEPEFCYEYNLIKLFSDKLKTKNALTGLHCCKNCDWEKIIDTNVNIISFDAYLYSIEDYALNFKKFLENGGKIAWGIIPTHDKYKALNISIEELETIFVNAVNNLTKRGINEKIIVENSLITPSCGAGTLENYLAERVMRLTKELSDRLKERYYDI